MGWDAAESAARTLKTNNRPAPSAIKTASKGSTSLSGIWADDPGRQLKENEVNLPRKQTGFTLIELLVVITIVGILAAMALPNFIKARAKAKEGEAKSNAHAIQVAVERYATDNGTYPSFLYGGDVWSTYTTSVSNLDPVVEGAGLSIDFSTYSGNPEAIPGDCDAMLQYGYLSAYPANPFVRRNKGNLGHIVVDPQDSTRVTGDRVARMSAAPSPRAGCDDLDSIDLWQFSVPAVPAGKNDNLMWDVSTGQRHPPFCVLVDGERAGGFYLAPDGTEGEDYTAGSHNDAGATGSYTNTSGETQLHYLLPGNFYYYPVFGSPGNWNMFYTGTAPSTGDIAGYRLACYGAIDNVGQDVYDMFGDFEDRMISGAVDNRQVDAEVPNLGGPDGRADGVVMVLSSSSDVRAAISQDLGDQKNFEVN